MCKVIKAAIFPGPQLASTTVSELLCFFVSPVPLCLSQKQLTQDDDADEVEIAVDNTAFMDEFFSEVGCCPVPFPKCT